MLRRLFLASMLALATVQPAAAQTFQPGDASLIPKAEEALLAIDRVAADFTFQNRAGVNTGRLFVDRGARLLRMEFDPPLSHLLIANGKRVDFLGGDGTVVNTGVDTTPLGLIFRENPRLSGEVKILEIATKGQNAYFAVGDVARPNAGKVVLHFLQTSPQWTFHGWGFIDPKGRYTKTILKNVQKNADLDPALFIAPKMDP